MQALELRRTFSQTVENDINCGICLTPFANPVIAPCGHSFCRNCIEEAIARTRACPLCHNPILSVSSLIPNRALSGLVETICRIVPRDRAVQGSNDLEDILRRTRGQSTDLLPNHIVDSVEEHFINKIKEVHESIRDHIRLNSESVEDDLLRIIQNQMLSLPRIVPLAAQVQLRIISRDIRLPIAIECTDRPSHVLRKIEAYYEGRGETIAYVDPSWHLTLQDGTHEIRLDKELPISLQCPQNRIPTHAAVTFYGTFQLERELRVGCLCDGFDPATAVEVRYSSCSNCGLTWICEACAERCHAGHTLTHQCTHKPTWACCYCYKKRSEQCSFKKK